MFYLFTISIIAAALAVAVPFRRYLVATGHVRLRMAFGACFLQLAMFFFGAAWGFMQPGSPNALFAEAIGNGFMALVGFFAAALFAPLALVFLAPTRISVIDRGNGPAGDAVEKERPSRLETALCCVLVVPPLLALTWLAFALFIPEAIAFPKTDQPVTWMKVITRPATSTLSGRNRTREGTTFSIQSASGEWKRITFTDRLEFKPQLAILSDDTVLLVGRTTPAVLSPIFVGAIFRRGKGAPAASIPESDSILPMPSGVIVATRLERYDRAHARGITIETYDSTGDSIGISNVGIPGELARCDWFPKGRLVDDDVVYSASRCQDGSGLYRVSPNGIQKITPFKRDVKKDLEIESSLTTAPDWYHGSWLSSSNLMGANDAGRAAALAPGGAR